MIVPFAPMALGGAVWYQGEANTDGSGGPQGYTCLFRQMIAAWRRLFGFTFPFVGVQLAPWNNTASTK
jgi:sialate O-acetylesterase